MHLTMHYGPAARMLKDMSQLVRDQSPSFARAGRKLTCTEDDMLSYRIGVRINFVRRLFGFCARMHAHAREVMIESLLHISK
jgi:hypothetical protein